MFDGTSGKKITKPGLFLNGQWYCNCKPSYPALNLTSKRETKNKGRQFWTCAKPNLDRCDFFIYNDEAAPREQAALFGLTQIPTRPQKQRTTSLMKKTRYPVRDEDDEEETEIPWSDSDEEVIRHQPQRSEQYTPRKAARTVFASPGKSKVGPASAFKKLTVTTPAQTPRGNRPEASGAGFDYNPAPIARPNFGQSPISSRPKMPSSNNVQDFFSGKKTGVVPPTPKTPGKDAPLDIEADVLKFLDNEGVFMSEETRENLKTLLSRSMMVSNGFIRSRDSMRKQLKEMKEENDKLKKQNYELDSKNTSITTDCNMAKSIRDQLRVEKEQLMEENRQLKSCLDDDDDDDEYDLAFSNTSSPLAQSANTGMSANSSPTPVQQADVVYPLLATAQTDSKIAIDAARPSMRFQPADTRTTSWQPVARNEDTVWKQLVKLHQGCLWCKTHGRPPHQYPSTDANKSFLLYCRTPDGKNFVNKYLHQFEAHQGHFVTDESQCTECLLPARLCYKKWPKKENEAPSKTCTHQNVVAFTALLTWCDEAARKRIIPGNSIVADDVCHTFHSWDEYQRWLFEPVYVNGMKAMNALWLAVRMIDNWEQYGPF